MPFRHLLLLAAAFSCAIPTDLAAYHQMYPAGEIARDAKRLETAVTKIFKVGIWPTLTSAERQALGKVKFRFPAPKPGDAPMNFYAFHDKARAVVTMPLLSLKQLEDLTTAYAWLHRNGHSLSTIDLYFAMQRRKPKAEFPRKKYPAILSALGVPGNANNDKKVDQLSLALRNEAIAFIVGHELGHVLFRHKGYDDITTAQARADEVQSDTLALDILGRTNTPPLGAVLFFQAQAYSMPHRGEYTSNAKWRAHLRKYGTHPLSTSRIDAMATYIAGSLTKRRPKEKATWLFIAKNLRKTTAVLNDVELQRCIARVAANAPLSALKPRKNIAGNLIAKSCR